jgi:hypothetical protein
LSNVYRILADHIPVKWLPKVNCKFQLMNLKSLGRWNLLWTTPVLPL